MVPLVCLFLVATVAARPSFPAFDSATGYIQQCDADNPCPRGLSCVNDVMFPDIKTCFRTSGDQQPRPGSCPSGVGGGSRCQFDSTCPSGQKCCGSGLTRFCTQAVPIPTQPTVTVLKEGVMRQKPDGFVFVSCISLVQADGKNILVDTGAMGQKNAMTAALQRKGLAYKDIDYIVTSHGHPDHYSNTPADIPNVFGNFIVTNSNYKFSPLAQKQQFMLTPNVEIKPTPGHTMQDNSVIVSNTAQGKIAVVGDLFFSEQDAGKAEAQGAQDPDKALSNRKAVLCNVDYIVPGHGPMFKVTAAQRQAHGC